MKLCSISNNARPALTVLCAAAAIVPLAIGVLIPAAARASCAESPNIRQEWCKDTNDCYPYAQDRLYFRVCWIKCCGYPSNVYVYAYNCGNNFEVTPATCCGHVGNDIPPPPGTSLCPPPPVE